MVCDTLCDRIALFNWPAVSERLYRRVPDLDWQLDVERNPVRLGCHDAGRNRCNLGGGLYALDVATRGVWPGDQSGKCKTLGSQLSRDWAADSVAGADAFHGGLSASFSGSIESQRGGSSQSRGRAPGRWVVRVEQTGLARDAS